MGCMKTSQYVAFVGAMAAGKTTLASSTAEALAGMKMKAIVLEETARLLVSEHKAPSAEELTDMINEARHDEFCEWQTSIAKRQDKIEADVGFAKQGKSERRLEWVFADRNVLDCIVYLGCCTDKRIVDRFLREPCVVRCLGRYKNVLTILVPPLPGDVERLDPSNITNDNIRPILQSNRMSTLLNPQRYHTTFVKILEQLDIPYVVLTKVELQERVGEVLQHMKTWRQRREHSTGGSSNTPE